MNPFTNPKKRSISLPRGCKELVDVLKRRQRERGDKKSVDLIAIKRFIWLVLFQMQQDHATEMVIGPAGGEATPIRYKVDGAWHDMAPLPSDIRSLVVTELEQMAGMAAGPFPKEGILCASIAGEPLEWRVRITDAGADCVITPIDE